jgi:hypothetical protein
LREQAVFWTAFNSHEEASMSTYLAISFALVEAESKGNDLSQVAIRPVSELKATKAWPVLHWRTKESIEARSVGELFSSVGDLETESMAVASLLATIGKIPAAKQNADLLAQEANAPLKVATDLPQTKEAFLKEYKEIIAREIELTTNMIKRISTSSAPDKAEMQKTFKQQAQQLIDLKKKLQDLAANTKITLSKLLSIHTKGYSMLPDAQKGSVLPPKELRSRTPN